MKFRQIFKPKTHKKMMTLVAGLCTAALLASCAGSPTEAATTTTAEQTTAAQTTAGPTTTAQSTTKAATPTPTPADTGLLDPKTTNLRGESLPTGSEAPRIIAAMLDNHPAARYQAGLKDADIVFEMPVEGSFTRYMALFQSKYPEVLGPVRSAREQFLDRLVEFDAVLMHYGGSVPATERIAAQGYETVDGMAIGSQYWRKNDTGKIAPHNAYTNLVRVKDYISARNWHENAEFDNYFFNATAKQPGGEEANEVIININSDNRTSYTYLPEKKLYERYKNGDLDLDENNLEAIEVSNIIIQNAKYYVYAATWQKVEQITSGTGYYISMGEIVPIKWTKESESSLTRYYTEDDQELALNPGQTWIQIVNLGVEPIVK